MTAYAFTFTSFVFWMYVSGMFMNSLLTQLSHIVFLLQFILKIKTEHLQPLSFLILDKCKVMIENYLIEKYLKIMNTV